MFGSEPGPGGKQVPHSDASKEVDQALPARFLPVGINRSQIHDIGRDRLTAGVMNYDFRTGCGGIERNGLDVEPERVRLLRYDLAGTYSHRRLQQTVNQPAPIRGFLRMFLLLASFKARKIGP
jgi:hypothetical protein